MAQEADPVAAAVAVVREAFDALERKDWAGAVRLTHPEALAGFQRKEVEQFRLRQQVEAQGQPVPAYRDPTMPPAVVEWFEQQAARHHEDAMAGLSKVYAVASIEELEALPAEEVATRWLAYSDLEATLRRDLDLQARERSSTVAASIDSNRVPVPRLRREVVGGVQESDDTVHVLYRLGHEMPGAPPFGFELAVITARATPDGWRLWAQPAHLPIAAAPTSTLIAVRPSGQAEAHDAWLREMAETVVAWPEAGPEAGRAFLRGLTSETKLPEALVIETRRNGETVRIEIPREAFQALSNLLTPWAFFDS